MAALSQIRCSQLNSQSEFHLSGKHLRSFPIESASIQKLSRKLPFSPLKSSFKPTLLPRLQPPCAASGGGGGGGATGSGGGSHGGWDGGHGGGDHSGSDSWFGPIGIFLSGWRSRVAADPQFPFKVLMEELVGVTACVIGDMFSRPNFGLNELDLVFSTLVVGSILNFVLMYLLAPTAGSTAQILPSIFAGCPPGHMFQPGPYGLFSRLGTFVYKGILFAGVGFGAGLVGTTISNGIISMKKKMDPTFETPNKPPPTLLNALTWSAHMGLSSNFRYQTLNGIEYVLDKFLPPFIFKSSVIGLRCANNVLGGISFVILARVTGSQAVAPPTPPSTSKDESDDTDAALKEKLLATKEEEPSSSKDSDSE